jgi:hypothetical protein
VLCRCPEGVWKPLSVFGVLSWGFWKQIRNCPDMWCVLQISRKGLQQTGNCSDILCLPQIFREGLEKNRNCLDMQPSGKVLNKPEIVWICGGSSRVSSREGLKETRNCPEMCCVLWIIRQGLWQIENCPNRLWSCTYPRGYQFWY